MNAEKERNRKIYEECLNGATYAEVAKKYAITISRVKNLYQKEVAKEENRSNKVFALLESLCDDEQLQSKTVTVLKRIEATTIDAVLALDIKTLKKTRNCGPVMQELIIKMQEEIRKKEIS